MDEKTHPSASEPDDSTVLESPDQPENPKQAPNLKGQLYALSLLIAVFAILYAVTTLLPKAADKIVKVTKSAIGGTDDPMEVPNSDQTEPIILTESKSNVPVEPTPPLQEPPSDQTTPTDPAAPIDDDSVHRQIIEAIGGKSDVEVEVRHIAFSTTEDRMIASLKIVSKDGESKLIEVLFKQDDFGRYISSDDSPLAVPITIWK